ncbi:MAG: RIP metalloprotease RseP [Arsenophonus sp.]|nr:MAG: RIP metalloprotease RseP [Arsenophonus sp.]
MKFIFILIISITTLAILIIVHESGHFLVARFFGVHVKRFSIGFGKILFRKKDRFGTEFVISSIPFGGYVKIADESFDILKQKCRFFLKDRVFTTRILIILGGSIFNFLLAILIYWIIFIFGLSFYKPIIGMVRPNSIAFNSNFTPNMEIKSIDNIKTPDWSTVNLVLINKIGQNQVNIEVFSHIDQSSIKKMIDLSQLNFNNSEKNIFHHLGIFPVHNLPQNVITYIELNSPFINSGLKIGDRIISVNNKKINSNNIFDFCVSECIYNDSILFNIERNGKEINLISRLKIKNITKYNSKNNFGIYLSSDFILNKSKIIEKHHPVSALYYAIKKVFYLIYFISGIMIKMLFKNLDFYHLNGPISFVKGVSFSLKTGLIYYFMFVSLISINLGIINLLPIPILDGGNLLLIIIEKIRGKKISLNTEKLIFNISMLFLLILMGFALFNDLIHF